MKTLLLPGSPHCQLSIQLRSIWPLSLASLAVAASLILRPLPVKADITLRSTDGAIGVYADVFSEPLDPNPVRVRDEKLDETWTTAFSGPVHADAVKDGGHASANGSLNAQLAIDGDTLTYTSASTITANFTSPDDFPGKLSSSAYGISDSTIKFTTTVRAPFFLSGAVSVNKGNSARVRLFGDGLDEEFVAENKALEYGAHSLSISKSGILEPGTYTITLRVFSGSPPAGEPGVSSGNLRLRIGPEEPGPEVRWTNPAGGSFQTTSNWDPQTVPDSTTTAIFDPAVAYSVNIGAAASDRLMIENGDVTFTNVAYTVGSIGFDPASVVLNNAKLTLADGQLNSGPALIGLRAASRVDVKADAVWISTGSVRVGGDGEGILSIAAGGTVQSAESRIGTGTARGDAFVSGTNATWDTGNLAVGFNGTGTLTIEDGADMTSGDSFVGREPGSNGQVIVRNLNANDDESVGGWDMDDHILVVGGDGQGNLKILAGGFVVAGKLIIRQHSTGSGSMTISGVSSSANPLTAELLLFDDAIIDGALLIDLGGRSTQLGDDFVIGFAFPGETTVRGFDPAGAFQSRLRGVGNLIVGFDANGKLTIDQGAQAESIKGTLGLDPEVHGDVLVEGNGNSTPSKWTLTDELLVGGEGTGSLQIKAGAQVTGVGSVIGRGVGSVGSEILVEGADVDNIPSKLELSGDLTVARSGSVAFLKVRDGARVSTGAVLIGENAGSQGTVLVEGRRSDTVFSSLVTSDEMCVGANGDGDLIVRDGARVSVNGGNLVMGGTVGAASDVTIGGRDPRSSFGAAVNVDGNLIMGSQADARSNLTINEDGVLSCIEATIGSVGPSTSKVKVGTVGGSGAPAELRTTGDMSVGTGTAAGLVELNGGIITVGGSLVMNRLSLISGNGTLAAPIRIRNGGTISPGLSPGRIIIEGNFEQTATGTLIMEIGGAAPGVTHDQLVVHGDVSLGGKLLVRFIGGFVPRQGEQFTLLETTSVTTGNFAEVEVRGLEPGFQFTAAPNATGQIVLTALNDGVPLSSKGAFRGLLSGDPAAHAAAGFFTIHANARDRFSASFVLGGRKFAVKGEFDADGSFSKVIPRKGSPPLTVSLDLAVLDDVRVITGTILDGASSIQLSAERADAFNAKKDPAPQAGKYTAVLLFDPAATDAPQADGIGVVKIAKSGAIRFTGALADGSRLSQGTALSKSGEWPLYVPLYKKQGSLFGELQFRDEPGSDFDGTLQWARPETTRGAMQTGGFVATLPVIGSRYVAPPARPMILDLPAGATAVLSDPDLAAPLTKSLALDSRNRFAVLDPGPDQLSLHAKKGNGLLSARFTHPATGLRAKVHGVIFQKQNFASGFFLQGGASGSFEIQANP